MDLNNFLEKVDVFGRPIQLTINGNLKHKTILGGVFSVCAYLIIAVLLVSKLIEFLKKTNPNVNYESFRSSVPSEMDYTEHDLSINIILLNSTDYKPIKEFPRIFYIDFNFYEMRRHNKTTIENQFKIMTKDCSEFKEIYTERNNFSDFYENNFLEMGACMGNTFKDPDTEEKKHIILKGAFITEYLSKITISVKKCNNTLLAISGKKYNCKSDQEIKEIVDNSFLEFYYIDKNIDYSNYHEPINKYFANQFWKLDYGSTWHGVMRFKNIGIRTDQGFFMQDFWQTDFFSFDTSSNFNEKNLKNDLFAAIEIVPSFLGERYQRTYIKIQDISTSIGGTFKLLLIFGNIITFLPYTYSLYESALQSLFSYTYEEKANDRIDLKIMKRIKEKIENSRGNGINKASRRGSIDKDNNDLNDNYKSYMNKDESGMSSLGKKKKKHLSKYSGGDRNGVIYANPSKDSINVQINDIQNNNSNELNEHRTKKEAVIFDDNKTLFKRNVSKRDIKSPDDTSRTILPKPLVNNSKNSQELMDNSNLSKSPNNLLRSNFSKISSISSLGLLNNNHSINQNDDSTLYKNKENQIELQDLIAENKAKNRVQNENELSSGSSKHNDILTQKLQKFDSIVDKIKNFQNDFIKFSLFDMINIEINFFCKNYKMTNNARIKAEKLNKISHYWDFLIIIRILRDSVMMKKILLNERQNNLFRFFDSNLVDFSNINVINDDHILDCLIPKQDNNNNNHQHQHHPHIDNGIQKFQKFVNKNFHLLVDDLHH